MKKLLAVMVVLVALVTLVSAAGAADVFLSKPANVAWRVNSTTDSTYKTLSMVGTTAIPDTTNMIDTADWAWGDQALASSASTSIGRIWVVSANTCAAVDTLFVRWDSSPDGENWNTGAYFGYGQGVTAGTDKVLSAPIQLLHNPAQTAGAAQPLAHSRYVRCVLRPDGNTSAVFTAAKFYYSVLKVRQ